MSADHRQQISEQLVRRISWEDLDPGYLRRLIETARDEDLDGLGLRHRPAARGDVTSELVPARRRGTADLIAREPLVVCGLPLLPLVLNSYGSGFSVQYRAADGMQLLPGAALASVHGDARTLLQAERVLLNFLQRLSGIASQTRESVERLGGSRTRLLDTRKTTPGHRMLEKYAVGCGGGWNHRLGLFDRVLIKDNHLAAGRAGHGEALVELVARARKTYPDLPVEVEVDRLDQIAPVLAAGADIILFDNFTAGQLRQAVGRVSGRAFTEASGGITLRQLPRFADLGLDFISSGALVHRSRWVDIALDWRAD